MGWERFWDWCWHNRLFCIVWFVCLGWTLYSLIFAANSIEDGIITVGCLFIVFCEVFHVVAFCVDTESGMDPPAVPKKADLEKDLFLVTTDHVAIAMVVVLTVQATQCKVQVATAQDVSPIILPFVVHF
jgi:hypothetical protein